MPVLKCWNACTEAVLNSQCPPWSPAVRGYNIGELAAARRYVEAAAELRVPVLGQQLFAFAEYGSDLGSSGEQLLCIAAGTMGRYWIGPEKGAAPGRLPAEG